VNGVHDMGGMHGLGPIVAEPDEPPFHHRWEARVHAMTLASPTRSNIDAGRHRRELIPGPDYLAMSYYEKWFRSLAELLLEAGLVTPQEMAEGEAAAGAPRAEPLLKAEAVATVLTRPGSYVRAAATRPAFRLGETVRCRNLNPTGHTRLPRYARGHAGEVVAWRGAQVFPDANASGLGEQPHHLYTVRFTARELWGEAADARDSVCLDLWEPYLEPA